MQIYFLRNGTKANVDYEMEERDGRFFCVHNDCKGKDEQSFETKEEVGEHWNVEHSTEEDGNDIGSCGNLYFHPRFLITLLPTTGKKVHNKISCQHIHNSWKWHVARFYIFLKCNAPFYRSDEVFSC